MHGYGRFYDNLKERLPSCKITPVLSDGRRYDIIL